APKSTGKIRAMKFWLPSHEPGVGSIIQIWDPYLFVMKSLDQAAGDFGIPVKKLSFNHEDVQQAYSSGILGDFIQANRQIIEEYNCRDVQVLRLLSNRVVEAICSITGFTAKNVLNTSTLPGLCYNFWTS